MRSLFHVAKLPAVSSVSPVDAEPNDISETNRYTPTQARPTRSSRGTLTGRLGQLLDIKRVSHKPAIKVESWDEHAAFEICEQWCTSQVRKPSITGLSRIFALNFERAQADEIPEDRKSQRLMPEGTSNEAYYHEMIVTFLKTVGIEDTAAVLDSFKRTGTGALHRKHVNASSAAVGAFGVARLAASAHPPAKTVLSSIQMLLTFLTSKLSFDSAALRFRNSGTEEIMPLGKADTSPGAKIGPNVLRAATQLTWDLRKISKNVRQMEEAQGALVAAHARKDNPDATDAECEQAKSDIRDAGNRLNVAFARFCLRNELKSNYKTAAESAKVEYHGNRRNLYISTGNGLLSATATVLGVLTPVAVSATVTAGASAVAVGITALTYIGYQLSSGPSKDGEEKAKRAIVALCKSLDLLAGNAAERQKGRAEAYRIYIAEKRIWNRPAVRRQAKAKLLAKLDAIALEDTTAHDLSPLQNWLDYAGHNRAVAEAAGDPVVIQELDNAYAQAHAAGFDPATAADAWKTPERMRFDSMGRLLTGKLCESCVSLLKFNSDASSHAARDTRQQAFVRAQHAAGKRADIKTRLRDWINFELAQSRMKAARDEHLPARARATMRIAAQSLAAIRDTDARSLFCGDARKQVDATELAKGMTIGERERYTLTNGGPAAMGWLANALGATTGFGLSVEKGVDRSHDIHMPARYGHQNDAKVFVQTSSPTTATYSAAERARLQKTSMAKLVKTIAREGDPVILKLNLPAGNAALFDAGDPHTDAALDKLMDELEALDDIPDEIALCIDGKKVSSGKLNTTTGYYNWRYRSAPLSRKARFQLRHAGIMAEGVGISVMSPIAQVAAQVPLSMSRLAVKRGNAMGQSVREQLTNLAQRSPSTQLAATQTAQAESTGDMPQYDRRQLNNASPQAKAASQAKAVADVAKPDKHKAPRIGSSSVPSSSSPLRSPRSPRGANGEPTIGTGPGMKPYTAKYPLRDGDGYGRSVLRHVKGEEPNGVASGKK